MNELSTLYSKLLYDRDGCLAILEREGVNEAVEGCARKLLDTVEACLCELRPLYYGFRESLEV